MSVGHVVLWNTSDPDNSSYETKPSSNLSSTPITNWHENLTVKIAPVYSSLKDQFADDKEKCTEHYCQNHLIEREQKQLQKCEKRMKMVYKNMMEMDGNGCRFMRGEGRPPVALVSHPGSGNTWVRALLEKATGICTGVCVYMYVCLGGGGGVEKSLKKT